MPVMLADPLGLIPGGGGCNTVRQNPDKDSEQTKAGDGSGPSFLDADSEADPDPPQRCGGSAPCEYTLAGCGSGFGPPGGLDGGASADDSGLGPTFGVGQSPGDFFSISGGLFYAFTGSDSFHWLDYDLEELLGLAAQGEISVSPTLFLDINALTPGDPQGPGGAPDKAMNKAKLTLLKPECIGFIANLVFAVGLGLEIKLPYGFQDAIQVSTAAPQMMVATLAQTTYTASSLNPTVANFTTLADTLTGSRSVTLYSGFYGAGTSTQAQVLIHEAVHDAFAFTDQMLASALTGKTYADSELGKAQASSDWNQQLAKHCK